MATLGAVELGGTKTLVAAGKHPDDLSAPLSIPTTDPDETLGRAVAFLAESDIEALGIASFGPLDLRDGRLLRTPKAGWSGVGVVERFAADLDVPIGLDTDVNGAALGEGEWGAGRGLDSFVYITVGTGIGGGVISGRRPLHGAPHPEVGHVVVRRHRGDDHTGSCPFHSDCLEGYAAGPSMAERFGKPAEQLTGADLERAFEFAVFYLAQGLRSVVYVAAPQRVIVGGGVSRIPGLHESLQAALARELGGYPSDLGDDFVVPPGLGDRSGLAGALLLARRSAGQETRDIVDDS